MSTSGIVKCLLSVALLAALLSCDRNTGDSNVPYISGISTQYADNKAVAGGAVVLTGHDFSPVTSENKIVCGTGREVQTLAVNTASATRLEFTAPAVQGNSLKIKVRVNGIESNEVILIYTTGEKESGDDVPTIVLDGAVTEEIRPGVEWTRFHGIWAGEVRNFNIVRTVLNEYNSLRIYNNYVNYRNLDEKCELLDALVGTNGPAQCCSYIRVDGKTMRAANEQDPWVNNCALTIDDGKVVDIVKVKDNFEAATLPNRNIGCAGPLLVWEGNVLEIQEEWKGQSYISTTHPRTAIGITRDGKTIIQVAVDGRYTTSNTEKRAIGLPMPVLARMMKELGCYKAMNFDGGGGTAMWIYGKGDHGIVNHPCDNSDWDSPWASLRATGNAVYVVSSLK